MYLHMYSTKTEVTAERSKSSTLHWLRWKLYLLCKSIPDVTSRKIQR